MKKKKIIDYKISRFSSVGSLEANYVKKLRRVEFYLIIWAKQEKIF